MSVMLLSVELYAYINNDIMTHIRKLQKVEHDVEVASSLSLSLFNYAEANLISGLKAHPECEQEYSILLSHKFKMKMMDEKAIELNYLDNGLGLSEYKSCKEASTLFVRSAMLFAASKKGFKPFKKELKSISVLLEKK